jgi:hypothetical protein
LNHLQSFTAAAVWWLSARYGKRRKEKQQKTGTEEDEALYLLNACANSYRLLKNPKSHPSDLSPYAILSVP